MTCEEFEELSGAYALNAVTSAERLAAEAHLATCARCTRLFQETRSVVSLLPLSVPQIPLPPSLQERILLAIRDESNSITGQPTQPMGDASVPTGTFPVISRRVLFYATASPKASCQSWVWGCDKSGPYAQAGPSARAHRAQLVARRVSLRGARAGRASG